MGITRGVVAACGEPGTEPPAKHTISARGCLVTPGLVNAHHHLSQILCRAFAPGCNVDFRGWARTVRPQWDGVTRAAIQDGALVGLAELAMGGCTTSVDHLFAHPSPGLGEAVVQAASEVGLRMHLVRGATDGGAQPRSGGSYQSIDTILADTAELVSRFHDPALQSKVRIATGPASAFDSSPDLFRASAALAQDLDIRQHTHAFYDPGEDEYCRQSYGRRFIDLLETSSWLSPRVWLAHGILVGATEIERLAQASVAVAHCPTAASILHGAMMPSREYLSAGVAVGLGCDGPGASAHGSMWLEARTALLMSRARLGTMSMSARDILRMATTGSAACLGREDEIGALLPGMCGDLAIWPLDGIAHAGGVSDPIEAWAWCGPVAPREVVVGGRSVVSDGRLLRADLSERVRKVNRHAARLQGVQRLTRG